MKRRAKWKVKLIDEAHLVDHGSFTITGWRVGLATFCIVVFFVLVGMGIVWFTPVKKRLPGYMPPEQRARTEEAYLRVDSLRQLYMVQQAYIDNIVRVLDTDRVPEKADTTNGALPLMPDSLLVSSEIEREFMKKMEEAGYVVTINREYEDIEE